MRALVLIFAYLAIVECCDYSDDCGPEQFCDGQESYYYPYEAECQSWLGWLQFIWSPIFDPTFIYRLRIKKVLGILKVASLP